MGKMFVTVINHGPAPSEKVFVVDACEEWAAQEIAYEKALASGFISPDGDVSFGATRQHESGSFLELYEQALIAQAPVEGTAILTLITNDDMVTVVRYSLIDGKLEFKSECLTGDSYSETRTAVLKVGGYHAVLTGDMWRDIEMNGLDDNLVKLFMTGDPNHVRTVGAMLEDGVMPCLCGADHTLPESVTREYVDKDGDDESSSEYGLGHYLADGTFEPDQSADLSGGRFDLLNDSDKCSQCGGQL